MSHLQLRQVPHHRKVLGILGLAGLAGCGDNAATNARLAAEAPLSDIVALVREPPPLFRDIGGPVYVRSDFMSVVPLTVTLTLTDVNDGCRPIAGALVQAWQCTSADYADRLTSALQVTDCNGQISFGTRCAGSGSRIQLRAYPGGVLEAPSETTLLPHDLSSAVYDTFLYVIPQSNVDVSMDEALSPAVLHQLCSMEANAASGLCDVSLSVGLSL